MNEKRDTDPRLYAIPDIHGHAKGEHKAFIDERPIPLSARMLFLWFYHACRRGWPRFLMVSDHMNYLTFEDPAAINLVRRALKLAQAGDLYGAAETASVEVGHAAVVSEGLRRGMRYSIGAEVDNDPRSRPDAQNIVDAMKPDGMIRSVHFLTVDHPAHGPNWAWPFDNPEFADVYEIVGTAKTWELYMATLLDAVERLPGNIVGHFYVPATFGHWPDDELLDGYENALVDACEARGMAIEFNTRFLYREHSEEEKAKFLAVHRRLLSKCKAKNVGIAIGSDAHSPKDQGAAFATVLDLLDACEINELVYPIAGRLARVALRVERKIEPVPEPPPVIAEERKVARKPRPSESPARTAVVAEAAAVTTVASEDDAASRPATPKPRPKRARPKKAPTTAAYGAESAAAGAVSDERESASSQPAGVREDEPTPVPDESASTAPQAVHVEAVQPLPDPVPSTQALDVEPEIAGAPPVAGLPPAGVEPDARPAKRRKPPARTAVAEPLPVAEPVSIAEFPPPITHSEIEARPARSKPRPAKPAAAKEKPAAARTKPAPAKPIKAPPKAATKKAPAKKAAVKKVVVQKAAAKKSAAKKTVPKKTVPKKAAVRAAGAKKAGGKKSAAKKASPKKPAQRRR